MKNNLLYRIRFIKILPELLRDLKKKFPLVCQPIVDKFINLGGFLSLKKNALFCTEMFLKEIGDQ